MYTVLYREVVVSLVENAKQGKEDRGTSGKWEGELLFYIDWPGNLMRGGLHFLPHVVWAVCLHLPASLGTEGRKSSD